MRLITRNFFILLPACCFIAILFIVPGIYSQKITTGFYRTDLYALWITGGISWIWVAFLYKPRLTRLTIAIASGCIYAVVLCLVKSFPDENSINACITMLACIGMLCYLRNMVTRHGLVLSQIVVLAFVVQVMIGFHELYKGNADAAFIQGDMANSGAFANYLSAIIPMLLAVVITTRSINRVIKIMAGIVLSAAVILLLFTQARAAWMGAAGGSAYVVFSLSVKKIQIHRLPVFVMGVIVIPLAIVSLYLLKPASAAGRITIYQVSLNIIKDHPVTGVGPNRFGAVYNNYQSDYFRAQERPLSRQLLAANILEAYNVVLQVLTEYGTIGFLLMVWVLYELTNISIVYTQRHLSKWLRMGSAGCLLSLLVAACFSNPFHITPVLLLVVYHLAIIVPPAQQQMVAPVKNYYLAAFAILACMALGYWIHQKHGTEKQWQEAAETATLNDFDNARRLYNKAYPVLRYNGDFLFNYGAEACVAGDYATAIELLEKAKQYSSLSNIRIYLGDAYAATHQYQLAEDNYIAAIYTTPAHIYPKYRLVQLYKKWGKINLASEWTKQTLQYPLKIPSELSNRLLQALKDNN